MQLLKCSTQSSEPMPLLAALSYAVSLDEGEEVVERPAYDPTSQRTVYAMGRDYSTSREDDSAGGLFNSKADTKKDD